jgi:hypothetical protein
MGRRGWAAALIGIVGIAASTQAAERLHLFSKPDREALRAWDGLLQSDPALAADARRHRFRPGRDLTVLRVDLSGDGRPELALYANLMPFCGSAGCMVRILTQGSGGWVLACETYAEVGVGLVIDSTRSEGWRNLRGTYRVTWHRDPSRPAGVTCSEGETVERSEQGRVAPVLGRSQAMTR